MTALSVTAANVITTATTLNNSYLSGAAITAGQAVYLDTATSTWKLADADATAPLAVVGGVAMNSAPAAGQPISVLTSGNYNPGATVTKGVFYCAGTTAGSIVPYSDLASTNYLSVFAIATSSSNLLLLNGAPLSTINAVVMP